MRNVFSLVNSGFITIKWLSVLSFIPGLCNKSTGRNLWNLYILNGKIVFLNISVLLK